MTRKKPVKKKTSSKIAVSNKARISRVLPEVSTKISPALAWVYPYLRRAKEKMPNLQLPSAIRSYKPSKTKVMRVLGNAYFANKLITIATHTQVTNLDKKGRLKISKIVRIPQARVLDTLAHELAHLEYGDHGYEHEEYSKMIFKTFGLKERCPHCAGSGKVDVDYRP